jgi:FkbM family methyltransferase
MINDELYLQTPLDIQKELLQFFKYKSPKFIFDIGACDGLDSIKYSWLFPNSKVYSFEPIDNNYNLILKNLDKYSISNIIVEKLALSDSDGEAEFYLSSGSPDNVENSDWDYGNKSSSLLKPGKTIEIHPWLKFENKQLVKTKTLKNYMDENKIQTIDFIHMDVQGAELMVLNGAGNYLKNIKMIWLEVENIELYKNQPLKTDVESFLIKNNFRKIKNTVNSIAGDQLWVQYSYFPHKLMSSFVYKIFNKIGLLK